jgi:hypothetical protein
MCSEDDDTPVGRREYELLLIGPARDDDEIGRLVNEAYDELFMVDVVKLPVPMPVPVPQYADEDELGKP